MNDRPARTLAAFGALAAALAVLPALPSRAAAAAPHAPPRPAAWFGPPAICHPIDIGDAPSLPWGDGPGWMTPARGYDPAHAADDALDRLLLTDETLVRMETIRRAVIYMKQRDGLSLGASAGEAQAERFVAALRRRAERGDEGAAGSAAGAAGSAAGAAWFDLAYALTALDQIGLGGFETDLALFDRAAELRPDDGALHLGAALASLGGYAPGEATWRHLDRTLALDDDPDGLLRRNLLSTMGRFLDVRSHAELVERVRRERKAA